MPSKEKYAPTHLNAPLEPAAKKGVRKSTLLSGVAMAATGVLVSSSMAVSDQAPTDAAASAIAAAKLERKGEPVSADVIMDRETDTASRSERRQSLAADKAKAQRVAAQKQAARQEAARQEAARQEAARQEAAQQALAQQDPREIARRLLPEYGFAQSEFSCLDALYVGESDWKVDADNPTSSAYGIPQALTELHDLPADYMTNPASQIEWGLWYIQDSYGTPCSALEFKEANGYY